MEERACFNVEDSMGICYSFRSPHMCYFFCLFIGKSSIMVGKDNNVENIGIIPCAISWLYQLIDDRKQR